MCKSKMSTNVIKSTLSQPNSPNCASPPSTTASSEFNRKQRRSSSSSNPSFAILSSTRNTDSYNQDSWQSSTSSLASLSMLKESLPEAPRIYDFAEIRTATNNFRSEPFSSSSSSCSWRCDLRSKYVIIFRRKLRRVIEHQDLLNRLSLVCRSHHMSLIKLHGVSISGNYIYLVYDCVNGANLRITLRNPKNPSFTILSTWLSRMQIATDLAHGLDYVHNHTGLESGFVHNRIKPTSIIVVAEPNLNAKICHFGTADLCGEITTANEKKSSEVKFEGTRGYMAPEFQTTGTVTKETDVFAFGVVILELFSGDEALKYSVDENTGGYVRVSVVETARAAMKNDNSDGRGGSGYGVRKWVDKRLNDSYPVEVAEKMIGLGLECVMEDPKERPGMGEVAGRISKLYLESVNLADRFDGPTDFSVSLAPR